MCVCVRNEKETSIEILLTFVSIIEEMFNLGQNEFYFAGRRIVIDIFIFFRISILLKRVRTTRNLSKHV